MHPALAVAIAAIVLAVPAHAQRVAPGVTLVSGAVTGFAQLDTGLDRGGDVEVTGAIASVEAYRQFDARFGAGLAVRYDYEDWSFAGANAFGGAPWGTLHRPSLALPLVWTPMTDVAVGVTPTLQWSFERGASSSDALIAGALLSATRTFSRDLTLGLGVGVFDDLEETRAFPLVVVNWRIDDRWRLGNPFRAGPAGGAGLELAYAVNDAWEVAAGGTWRSARFRLDRDGIAPGGIGESRSVPLFVRASWQASRDVRLDVHAGAAVGGKLILMDAEGRELVEEDVDTAPILGITLRTRF
ncbi:MAG TPA: DUF6268 family outer membrane beta-barrel protein [Casimicrobiaceae bacterium]|nr:DUF6268 family outer membrane beta-barrel protein [Casimicrobiaceae bacterium]